MSSKHQSLNLQSRMSKSCLTVNECVAILKNYDSFVTMSTSPTNPKPGDIVIYINDQTPDGWRRDRHQWISKGNDFIPKHQPKLYCRCFTHITKPSFMKRAYCLVTDNCVNDDLVLIHYTVTEPPESDAQSTAARNHSNVVSGDTEITSHISTREETKLKSSMCPPTVIPCKNSKSWLPLNEYISMLANINSFKTISTPPVKSKPGDIVIYFNDKEPANWRRDEYRWVSKGNKLIPYPPHTLYCRYFTHFSEPSFKKIAYHLVTGDTVTETPCLIHYTGSQPPETEAPHGNKEHDFHINYLANKSKPKMEWPYRLQLDKQKLSSLCGESAEGDLHSTASPSSIRSWLSINQYINLLKNKNLYKTISTPPVESKPGDIVIYFNVNEPDSWRRDQYRWVSKSNNFIPENKPKLYCRYFVHSTEPGFKKRAFCLVTDNIVSETPILIHYTGCQPPRRDALLRKSKRNLHINSMVAQINNNRASRLQVDEQKLFSISGESCGMGLHSTAGASSLSPELKQVQFAAARNQSNVVSSDTEISSCISTSEEIKLESSKKIKLKSSVCPSSIIPCKIAKKWFTTNKYISMLKNINSFKTISTPPVKPKPGDIVIYLNDKEPQKWRKDGYHWVSKGNNFIPKNQPELYCRYFVHSAKPGFKKRAFCLLTDSIVSETPVLIHYNGSQPPEREAPHGNTKRNVHFNSMAAKAKRKIQRLPKTDMLPVHKQELSSLSVDPAEMDLHSTAGASSLSPELEQVQFAAARNHSNVVSSDTEISSYISTSEEIKLKSSVCPSSIIPCKIAKKWFTINKYISMLKNINSFKTISTPPVKPKPGDIVIYLNDEEPEKWRKDGYHWVSKGNNFIPKNQPVLYCRYFVHSAQPGFRKRAFCLLTDSIVSETPILIHYNGSQPPEREAPHGNKKRNVHFNSMAAKAKRKIQRLPRTDMLPVHKQELSSLSVDPAEMDLDSTAGASSLSPELEHVQFAAARHNSNEVSSDTEISSCNSTSEEIKLKSSVCPSSIIPCKIAKKWFTINKYISMLKNINSFKTISTPPVKPKPGDIVIYLNDEEPEKWRKDGYRWISKGNNFIHKNQPELYCRYFVHSAQPGFRKRAFCLLTDSIVSETPVLIHYNGSQPPEREAPHGNKKRNVHFNSMAAKAKRKIQRLPRTDMLPVHKQELSSLSVDPAEMDSHSTAGASSLSPELEQVQFAVATHNSNEVSSDTEISSHISTREDTKLMSSMCPSAIIPCKIAKKWFTINRYISMLKNINSFRTISTPPVKPKPGDIVIYLNDKEPQKWRRDGYRWVSKGNNFIPKNQPELYCRYFVHSAKPGFKKRAFCLLTDSMVSETPVLIHYNGSQPPEREAPHGNKKRNVHFNSMAAKPKWKIQRLPRTDMLPVHKQEPSSSSGDPAEMDLHSTADASSLSPELEHVQFAAATHNSNEVSSDTEISSHISASEDTKLMSSMCPFSIIPCKTAFSWLTINEYITMLKDFNSFKTISTPPVKPKPGDIVIYLNDTDPEKWRRDQYRWVSKGNSLIPTHQPEVYCKYFTHCAEPGFKKRAYHLVTDNIISETPVLIHYTGCEPPEREAPHGNRKRNLHINFLVAKSRKKQRLSRTAMLLVHTQELPSLSGDPAEMDLHSTAGALSLPLELEQVQFPAAKNHSNEVSSDTEISSHISTREETKLMSSKCPSSFIPCTTALSWLPLNEYVTMLKNMNLFKTISTPPVKSKPGDIVIYFNDKEPNIWRRDGYQWVSTCNTFIPNPHHELHCRYFTHFSEPGFKKRAYHLVTDNIVTETPVLIHYTGCLPQDEDGLHGNTNRKLNINFLTAKSQLKKPRLLGTTMLQVDNQKLSKGTSMLQQKMHRFSRASKLQLKKERFSRTTKLQLKKQMLCRTDMLQLKKERLARRSKSYTKIHKNLQLEHMPSNMTHQNLKEDQHSAALKHLKKTSNYEDSHSSILREETRNAASNFNQVLCAAAQKPSNGTASSDVDVPGYTLSKKQTWLLSSCSIARKLGSFVHDIHIIPDSYVILHNDRMIDVFNDLSIIVNTILYYETFNLEFLYLSVLSFCHPVLKPTKVIPLAYFIHEHKTKALHKCFFAYIFKRIPTLCGHTIVTCREPAIIGAIEDEGQDIRHVFCWNNIIQNVTSWVITNSEHVCMKDIKYYTQAVLDLLKSTSEEDYECKKKDMCVHWSEDFIKYFSSDLESDLKSSGKWVLIEHYICIPGTGIVMNTADRLNSVLKSTTEIEIGEIILRLKYIDTDYLEEVCCGSQVKVDVPILDCSLNTLMENINRTYIDNIHMMAKQLLLSGKVRHFADEGVFIISENNLDIKYTVQLLPRESCTCQAEGYCYHIEAARLVTGSSNQIKTLAKAASSETDKYKQIAGPSTKKRSRVD